MRTLKKTLCLILALVMVLGVCAISATADFTDQAAIKHTEAVDLMVGMGVLSGMGDGTFAPTATLTRAQAAKIIAFICGGDKLGMKSSFTDTKGHWGDSVIAYCAAAGIVGGYGNGKFGPDDTLKGNQFAKMLLLAAGVEDEKLSDPVAWEIAVATNAKATGLTAGLGTAFDLTADLSRDDACQMAYNAMMFDPDGETYFFAPAAPTIKFKTFAEAFVANGNNATGIVEKTDSLGSLYAKSFSGRSDSGVITANDSNTVATTANPGGTTTINGSVYQLKTGADLYGHYVTVYYHTVAGKRQVYSLVDETVSIDVTGRENAAALKTALLDAGFVGADGSAIIGFNTKYNNGAAASAVADAVTVTLGTTTGATLKNSAGTPVVVSPCTLYAHYVGTTLTAYGYATPDAETIGYVSAINGKTGAITVAGAGTLQNSTTRDEVNEYDGIAVGDPVVYTNTNGVYNLSKLTTVEGKITARNTTYKTVTVDGKTYSTGAAYADSNIQTVGLGLTLTDLSATTLGSSYVLYLDPNGDVVAIVASASTSDAGIIYLTGKYETAAAGAYGAITSYFIQGVNTAGEEVTFQVTGTEHGKIPGTNALNTLYKVTTAYDPTLKATVATLTAATSAGTLVVGATAPAINRTDVKVSGTNDYFASTTKFIYVTGNLGTLKVTVKEGKQVTALNTYKYIGTKVTAAAANSTVQAVFVGGAAPTATAGTGIIFATGAFGTTDAISTTIAGAPATAYNQKVYIDGEPATILTAGVNDAAGSPVAKGFYTYTVDADGIYALTSVTTTGAAHVDVILNNYYGDLLSWTSAYGTASSAANHNLDVSAPSTSVAVVNTMSPIFDANYEYISTDLATIVAENMDDDNGDTNVNASDRHYTVSVFVDMTGTIPVVKTVYITASDVTVND